MKIFVVITVLLTIAASCLVIWLWLRLAGRRRDKVQGHTQSTGGPETEVFRDRR